MEKDRIIFYIDSTLTAGAWGWLFCFLSSLGYPCQMKAFAERSKLAAEYRAAALEIFFWGESNRQTKLPFGQDDSVVHIVQDLKKQAEGLSIKGKAIPSRVQIFDLKDGSEKVIREFLTALRQELPAKSCLPTPKPAKLASFTMDLEIEPGADLRQLNEWLDWLAEKAIRITVFLTGTSMRELSNHQEIMEKLRRHQIGNHTLNHRNVRSFNIIKNHYCLESLFDNAPQVFRAPRLEVNPGMYRCLETLGYPADSSLFGFQLFPVIIRGKNTGIIEAPLLDGGDYHFFDQKKLSLPAYQDYLRKRLSKLSTFNSGFSLLFHYQYSSTIHWKTAVETIIEQGYHLATVEDQIQEYMKSQV